jgi:uncharacterized membrane protein YdjX (TVP38/TMEM64 family)
MECVLVAWELQPHCCAECPLEHFQAVLRESMVSCQHDIGKQRRVWLAVAILALLFGMAAAWKWTPLAEQINILNIKSWILSLRNNPARPVIMIAGYLVGSVLLVPITVLIVAAALVLGPVLGSAYSLAGCSLAAALTYAIGYFVGGDLVRRLTGRRWARVEQQISHSGVLAIATLRLLPVAPFTIVNVISGAFQVPFRNYILGSLLGLTPGILLINLFAHQMEDAVRNPGAGTFTLLAVLAIASGAVVLWFRQKIKKRRAQ